ncbi:unnamed protein product [Rotaria sp. Silwood1]|nr:unnamed protein product [Rotaria sp. Silwood1]CAF1375455.1 unnamed protein product [Rotaria sp. Silwood1]CAF3613915.1 unnamed protein product [Rotaria sp. Silwood1]
MGDIAGRWQVVLADGIHTVEFEHGTTSGKRVIRVDNNEVLRHSWLFKLVGTETFKIGTHKCTITIEAVDNFAYEYSLEVDGTPLEKFNKNRSKISRTWILTLDGVDYRVVFEKDTVHLWVNGQIIEAEVNFTDYGTETVFEINGHPAVLKAGSSNHPRSGIQHNLFVDGCLVPQADESEIQ